MLAGASVVFFSFLGFENIVNLAAETKDPGRSLPRAILVSLCAAIALYVLVALAVVALVEPSALAQSSAPLTSAVRKTSPQLASVLSGVALFATANTALASIVSGSRVLYGMSEEGQLPGTLGKLLEKRKTPWVATLILSGIAGALLPLGSVGAVASVSSFAALIAFVLVNAAVIVLRRSKPKLDRPFRVPIGLAIGAGVLVVLAVGRVVVVARAPQ